MAFFNQPSERAAITCSAGCGASIEYGLSFREEWLHIQDEETPELRFYCPDCKGKADISGDPRMGQFKAACSELLTHLETWAADYEAIADDYGDWLESHGIHTCYLKALYGDTTFPGGLSDALSQIYELDLDGNEQDAERGTCVFCGAPLDANGGNDPDPAYTDDDEARCCDACNLQIVLPARLDIAKLITKRNGGELVCVSVPQDGRAPESVPACQSNTDASAQGEDGCPQVDSTTATAGDDVGKA